MRGADGTAREFDLAMSTVVVGRMSYCDLQVALPTVGTRHCELQLEGDGVTVRDLGTELGTMVNGHRVDSTVMHHDDVLHIGPVQFRLHDRSLAAAPTSVSETTIEPQDTSSGSEVVVMRQPHSSPRRQR